MTEFKPGDKVRSKLTGRPFTVSFGPFPSAMSDQPYYVLTDDAGYGWPMPGGDFAPAPPADPRWDVIVQALATADGCKDHPEWYSEEADAVVSALDAMTSDAPARYRDRDGDTWEEQPDGRYLHVQAPYSGGVDFEDSHYVKASRDHLARAYGPLTRVN